MKKSLERFAEDLYKTSQIEMKIGREPIFNEDAEFLFAQAEKGSPRHEFDFGLYIWFVEGRELEAKYWIKKAKQHANGWYLWNMSRILDQMGDDWKQLSIECLRRSAWHKYPQAVEKMRAIKSAK